MPIVAKVNDVANEHLVYVIIQSVSLSISPISKTLSKVCYTDEIDRVFIWATHINNNQNTKCCKINLYRWSERTVIHRQYFTITNCSGWESSATFSNTTDFQFPEVINSFLATANTCINSFQHPPPKPRK